MEISQRTLDTQKHRIEHALERGKIHEAIAIWLNLHPADRAELFNELDDEHQRTLLTHLDISTLADLLEELDDEEALEAAEEISTDKLADVLDEMEPDEAADLLGDMPPEKASEALAEMEDADEVRPLLGYPDETAGGLMTTTYIALRRYTTVSQAIEFLRQVSDITEIPYYLYVVDKERRLVGVVDLRDLLKADPDTVMEDLMDPDVISVEAGADQEDVARIMAKYDLAAIPVVDAKRRLIGVITYDDIVDVLESEATEDIYHLANVSDEDLDPESPLTEQLKGRLPWLYLNTLTALFASWVISRFESIIAQAAVLALFQSVVAGQGGNAASQNVAMTVRAIALGKLTPKALLRVLARQFVIGLMLGVAVGSAVGFGVYLWRGNLYLSLVLGLALLGNLSVGSVVGVLVPLLLQSLGVDPALASSILVTAVTDASGFFIFLSLAAHFLRFIKAG
jgi:magnesium transporter